MINSLIVSLNTTIQNGNATMSINPNSVSFVITTNSYELLFFRYSLGNLPVSVSSNSYGSYSQAGWYSSSSQFAGKPFGVIWNQAQNYFEVNDSLSGDTITFQYLGSSNGGSSGGNGNSGQTTSTTTSKAPIVAIVTSISNVVSNALGSGEIILGVILFICVIIVLFVSLGYKGKRLKKDYS